MPDYLRVVYAGGVYEIADPLIAAMLTEAIQTRNDTRDIAKEIAKRLRRLARALRESSELRAPTPRDYAEIVDECAEVLERCE